MNITYFLLRFVDYRFVVENKVNFGIAPSKIEKEIKKNGGAIVEFINYDYLLVRHETEKSFFEIMEKVQEVYKKNMEDKNREIVKVQTAFDDYLAVLGIPVDKTSHWGD